MLFLATIALGAPDWLDDPAVVLPPSTVVHAPDHLGALARAPLLELTSRGLQVLRRTDGHVPTRLGWIPIRGSRAQLMALRADGIEVRADRHLDLGPAPTLITGQLTQTTATRARSGSRGAGMAIANIDTHIDLLHPHFFFPDAGVFDWVDVDEDGVLTPGVDGIDLDGDGLIAIDETLEEIDASAFHYDPDSGDGVLETTQGLDPSRDWLFLDLDGNFRRTAGRPGWTDDDPGLGEPTYVPDDVDGDGVIEPGERLWQLGTPVVRSVYWDFTPYRRGQDLTFYMEESGEVDRSHGTQASGLLVGGQLPDQRRFSGLVPEADLVFVSRLSVNTYAELITFTDYVADRDVDVVLHEYSPWMGWSMDGTSLLEQLVDDLADQGMVQVCPVGNLGESGKHTRLEGDGVFSTGITLTQPLPWLFLEWHYEGEGPVACELTGPEDFRMKRTEIGYQRLGAFDTWVETEVSEGGRGRSSFIIQGAPGQMPQGQWNLACEGEVEVLDVYLLDFGQFTRNAVMEVEHSVHTMGVPSTARGCIAVGAAAGQLTAEHQSHGELRTFSSRGPALGGQKSIDLIAPEDAFGPDTARPYSAFNGTSGAATQVAAAALLVKAEHPELSGFEVKALLEQGADGSLFSTQAPDDAWGWGNLATYQALYDEPPDPVPPLQDLELSIEAAPDCGFVGTGQPGMEIRWDLDYDGLVDHTGSTVDLTAGQQVRAEGFVDGYWVGTALLIAPTQCSEPEPGGCGCRIGGIEATPWGPIKWVGMRRARRGRSCSAPAP